VVDYLEPAIPRADIQIDETLGRTQIILFAGDDPDLPDTASLGLYRVVDGRTISLGQGLAQYTAITDIYPPVGKEFIYLVVAYTPNGLTSRIEYTVIVKAHGALVINFGEDMRHVAKVSLNRQADALITPSYATYPTAGNRDPLVFFGAPEETSGSISGVVYQEMPAWPDASDPSTLADIQALATYHGICLLRSKTLGTIPVALSASIKDTGNRELAEVSINWIKVRSHGLAF
jgi:hypothetical protein